MVPDVSLGQRSESSHSYTTMLPLHPKAHLPPGISSATFLRDERPKKKTLKPKPDIFCSQSAKTAFFFFL